VTLIPKQFLVYMQATDFCEAFKLDQMESLSRYDKGTELQKASDMQLKGLESPFLARLKQMPDPPISIEDWKKLAAELRMGVDQKGVGMTCFAAWERFD
jgi:hypothetical protein